MNTRKQTNVQPAFQLIMTLTLHLEQPKEGKEEKLGKDRVSAIWFV